MPKLQDVCWMNSEFPFFTFSSCYNTAEGETSSALQPFRRCHFETSTPRMKIYNKIFAYMCCCVTATRVQCWQVFQVVHICYTCHYMSTELDDNLSETDKKDVLRIVLDWARDKWRHYDYDKFRIVDKEIESTRMLRKYGMQYIEMVKDQRATERTHGYFQFPLPASTASTTWVLFHISIHTYIYIFKCIYMCIRKYSATRICI